jgi:hypothetical protein
VSGYGLRVLPKSLCVESLVFQAVILGGGTFERWGIVGCRDKSLEGIMELQSLSGFLFGDGSICTHSHML